jgi:hypothetical protein
MELKINLECPECGNKSVETIKVKDLSHLEKLTKESTDKKCKCCLQHFPYTLKISPKEMIYC